MIYNKLSELLEKSDETMYSLSKKTGISYKHILKINNDKFSDVKISTIEKIITALECNLNDILISISSEDYMKIEINKIGFSTKNLKLMYEIFYKNDVYLPEILQFSKQCTDLVLRKIYISNAALIKKYNDIIFNFSACLFFYEKKWYIYFNVFDIEPFKSEKYEGQDIFVNIEKRSKRIINWFNENECAKNYFLNTLKSIDEYCLKIGIHGIIIDNISSLDPHTTGKPFDYIVKFMIKNDYDLMSTSTFDTGVELSPLPSLGNFFIKNL
jgi:DNA-binding Xre family transcriptional regulator